MPTQVKILPISERQHDYANRVCAQLHAAGIRVEVDARNEKIGYKIREAQNEKIPYMLVVGDKETENGTVAVRARKDGDLGAMTVDAFRAKILDEIATKAR